MAMLNLPKRLSRLSTIPELTGFKHSLTASIVSLLILVSNTALAAPSHFSITVGSALLCRSQVSSAYFNDYMATFFGKPAFTSGGANWWKVSDTLFGSQLEYVFVGTDLDFIGATFKDTPDRLIANVKSSVGIDYQQKEAEKWVTPSYSALIKYNDNNTKSKMFCIGSPYSPDLT
jgi:hypothetical protein